MPAPAIPSPLDAPATMAPAMAGTTIVGIQNQELVSPD